MMPLVLGQNCYDCACADDVVSFCLVKECVELEMFGCVVVQKLLQGEDVDFRSESLCIKIATCPFRGVSIEPL